jgi:hypothetical protein
VSSATASLSRCRLTPEPWRPIADLEWAELRVWLPHGDSDVPHRGPGRPPKNLRRTVDAIFWVAASKGPWKDLLPELGKPGTAHRTLTRWARGERDTAPVTAVVPMPTRKTPIEFFLMAY